MVHAHDILFQSKIFCPSNTPNGNMLNIAIQALNEAPAYRYDWYGYKWVNIRNENPITKLVSGPMSATFPNLFLSDNPTITAPGAINLNGMIGSADIAVIIRPYSCARNSAQLQ